LSNIERLIGSDYNDSLGGSSGTDLLAGGSGNDTLDGAAGNDTLDGDAGTDTASYASATIGVTVSLALTSAQNTVGAGTDTLISIEKLIGGSSNDSLTGSIGNNSISGGAGNDTLDGGVGNDSLAGGAGIDTFVIGAGSDVITDLGLGGADVLQIAGGASLSATLATAWSATAASSNAGTAGLLASGFSVNLAAVTGAKGWNVSNNASATAVTLTGSSYADTLTGGSGSDTISGGAGDDVLYSGGGADRFLYGALGWGHDRISGFTQGLAKLDFNGSGISFGQLQLLASGADTHIVFGSNTILVYNTSLTSGDFLF